MKFKFWFASGDDADEDEAAVYEAAVYEDLGVLELIDESGDAVVTMETATELPMSADMDAAYKALIAQVKAQEAEAAKPAPPQIIVQVRPVENGWLITWQPDMPFTPPGSSHTRFVATVQEAQQLLGSLLSGE